MKYRLCTNEEDLKIMASRPEFLNSVIFNDNLIGVHLAKDKVKLTKPIYIGQAVLDLSKLIMYELYYNTLQGYAKDAGGSIEIMGGDTDSLFLKTTDIDVKNYLIPRMSHDEVLDTSNYPKDHPQFSNRCKARLGSIKDEAGGRPFKEWILLRPKAYSMLAADGKEYKRAKGVSYATVCREIRHSHYRDVFLNQMATSHVQRRIGSKLHQLYNFTYNKKTLSFFEDKRAWTSINSSLPYGNHLLGDVAKPVGKRILNVPTLVQSAAVKADRAVQNLDFSPHIMKYSKTILKRTSVSVESASKKARPLL